MNHPIWHNIHPDFRFNGASYTNDELIALGKELVNTDEAYQVHIGQFLLDWLSDKSIVEVSTSGSTGTPKIIELRKEHMVNSALATGAYFQLEPRQKALLCLPLTGIAGKMMLIRAMVLGLHLDAVEPSSKPLQENKTYDFAAMVPLQVQNSIDQLSQIRKLIIGGAPVDTKLRYILRDSSVEAFETYGMTETITHIAVKKTNHKPSEYFETLSGVTIQTDDRGCLVIDAPKISDAEVVTNDLVEINGENQFKWLGRYDSIINSGGIKLFPEKIEEKLAPLIRERFFLAGLPDETLGQKLVLVVEGEPYNEQDLLQSIKSLPSISKYEVPKQVYFVKTFTETATQKINRTKTLERIT
ncbi:AMP-binding protein [Flagellimonas zhangzhouensis]|uniref:O-succinylbenzoic acid--CoA ligase n=1 Tax=Flagellimonas zhangzhouensis TaxID=1073328 RepID=A0A1H2SUZ7_9FLAO|nr:AMP-binding protein [Allomuricauda zhangzhouensis]SDQ79651.1 O-succinylbenzoic acid--CoA ligase [Allomuricauda zhangzhouensis]SDW35357.1 O-succinylbenzoic acid--CoA ligase [Allomuricauda zhangzhouensis]